MFDIRPRKIYGLNVTVLCLFEQIVFIQFWPFFHPLHVLVSCIMVIKNCADRSGNNWQRERERKNNASVCKKYKENITRQKNANVFQLNARAVPPSHDHLSCMTSIESNDHGQVGNYWQTRFATLSNLCIIISQIQYNRPHLWIRIESIKLVVISTDSR